MNRLYLFLIIIFSVEIFIKFKVTFKVKSILLTLQKASGIISSKKISDNKKERIIPLYSLRLIKISFKILLIFFFIFSLFSFFNTLSTNFLKFSVSLRGILETLFFGYLYYSTRKSIVK